MRPRTLLVPIGVTTTALLAATAVGHAAPAAPSASTHGDDAVQTRVVGGVAATTNPGVTSLQYETGKHFCTSSLIAPQWAITAKHCMMGGKKGMPQIRLGGLKQNDGFVVKAISSVDHSKADLTLLKLEREIKPEEVKPVTLVDAMPTVGTEVTGWGWGFTGSSGPLSDVLKFATMKISMTNAQDAYGGTALRCSGVDGTPWKGDSGGPTFANGIQVGVLSTGDDRAKITNYVSVATYREWIKTTAGV